MNKSKRVSSQDLRRFELAKQRASSMLGLSNREHLQTFDNGHQNDVTNLKMRKQASASNNRARECSVHAQRDNNGSQ